MRLSNANSCKMAAKKYCILLSEDLFTFTNSVDPDKMLHHAAFNQCLQCF